MRTYFFKLKTEKAYFCTPKNIQNMEYSAPNMQERENQKKRELRQYQGYALSALLLMVAVYVVSFWAYDIQHISWVGFFKAFSEAAMVGALADWFAVTALFYHPMGIPIPHTNLIQNNKNKIGKNLGDFVVNEFLTDEKIDEQLQKINFSKLLADWLEKDKNQDNIVMQVMHMSESVLNKLNDQEVVAFITGQTQQMLGKIQLNQLVGDGMHYLIEKQEHQKLVTHISDLLEQYIMQNQEIVRNRVRKESYSIIPSFVDDAIADKITQGLSKYFQEIKNQPKHPIRSKIDAQLFLFANDLQKSPRWKNRLDQVRAHFLEEENLKQYALDLWLNIKFSFHKEIDKPNSAFKRYLKNQLKILARALRANTPAVKNKIALITNELALTIKRNRESFSKFISETVEKWEGKELSHKFELEVGKDLQFIRLNGTIIGGIVGVLIYLITHYFLLPFLG